MSRRRLALAGGAVVLALGGSACGEPSFESELDNHLRDAPPERSVRTLGQVKSVHCFPTGLTYRDARVSSCDVTYSSGDLTDICAARIDGEIVTQRDDRALPCIAHSQPAPGPWM